MDRGYLILQSSKFVPGTKFVLTKVQKQILTLLILTLVSNCFELCNLKPFYFTSIVLSVNWTTYVASKSPKDKQRKTGHWENENDSKSKIQIM